MFESDFGEVFCGRLLIFKGESKEIFEVFLVGASGVFGSAPREEK